MCGVVGILKLDGNIISDNELIKFTKSLNHRGPDGSGIYLDKSKTVGLGHTRTSTFDLSKAGHQPMGYLNERYWITFNGDIYNFIEIKKELQNLGYIFISNSDTEVILAAYSKWGDKCQFKFNGDWAFAIWDNKEKNLFLACDRFGTKPLHYLRHRNYFIFASELKAFMHLKKNIKPEFDYGHFLWFGKNHGVLNTFLKNVFTMQGGHQININQNNTFKLKKWWSTINHLVEVPKNYKDQVAHFKELAFNACKIRMRADVPIASCLSGGVDSSSIASIIAKIREDDPNNIDYKEKNQNVFIMDYLGDKNSEKHFANDVVYNKNITSNYIELNPSILTPESLIKSQFDMEHIDVEAINLSLLYKKIREKGIRISLDGGTPDETFGGYRDDALLAMRDCFWSWSKRQRFKDLSSIWKELNLIPNDKNMRMIIFKEITKIKEIKKFIESLKNKKDLFSLIDKNKSIYPQEDDIKNLNYFDSYLYKSFHYITSPFIFHKHDKISMANGVISRAPFTDPNIITYIFSLPSSSKIGCGYTKRILRDSMKNIVPDSVLQRKDKRGFTAPPNWYENNMKDYILDSISSTNFLESNFFDGKKIKNNFENKLIRNRNPSKLVLRYVAINSLVDSFKKIN